LRKDKFSNCLGIKKRTKSEIYEEWDAKMRSQYYDPIERFPEKIDELLQVFDRVNLFYLLIFFS